jgi:putative transposase
MTEAEVMSKYVSGEFVVDVETLPSEGPACHVLVPRDLSTFPAKDQQEALRRHKYLLKLPEIGPIRFSEHYLTEMIAKVAAELGDPSPPSLSSIFRWKQKFEAGNSVSSLVSKNENKGRCTTMSEEVQKIVDAAIEEVYLNRQKYSKKEVCERVRKEIRTINKTRSKADAVSEPSKATIYRYLDKLYRYEVDVSRLGKIGAEKNNRPSLGMVRVNRIHERWEIDHTPLDFLVYCEDSGLPMGRPWFTGILDRYSRYIVGYYISFQHPSANSVLQAVVHAILPKENQLSKYPDIQATWLAKGIGEKIVCDNGMDLHAGSFIMTCQELGMQVWFCPAKTPQYKGAIERFFRTLNHGLIHKLPGSVFNNPKERGDYESEKLAAIGFQTLNHLVTKWIVEVYHQTPHRSLRTTPHDMWQKSLPGRVIEYPVSPEQLRIIAGKTEKRSLFRYGFELDGLKYNNELIQSIRRRTGETTEMTIKYYEEDAGHIHVWDPHEKAYLRVEAVNAEYTKGLHRAQHRLIRQRALDLQYDTTDIDRLLEVKDEIAGIILQATKSKKMIERKKAAQVRAINSANQGGNLDRAIKPVEKSVPIIEEEDFGLDDDLPSLAVQRGYFSNNSKHQEI